MDALSRGIYPSTNTYNNSSTVIQWIVSLQQLHFKNFLFAHSIYQSNHKTIHFSIRIADSKQIDHIFDIQFDVEQVRRKAKLERIKNKIYEL